MAGSMRGAPGSYTEAGPPDRMIPLGFSSATRAAGRSWRTIWQKTFRSRTRRAISWAYWDPKSKIRTSSLAGDGAIRVGHLGSGFGRLGELLEQLLHGGL